LDLSAAYDTIDHKILINRLSNSFGISGSVLGPESYDRDLQYRRGLLITTISQHRIGMTISLRRDIVT